MLPPNFACEPFVMRDLGAPRAFVIASSSRLEFLMSTPLFKADRLDAWYDGSAICVIAVGTHGDPLDLVEGEVEAFIEKLKRCHCDATDSPNGAD